MIEFVYVVEYDKLSIWQDPYLRNRNGVLYRLDPVLERNQERKICLTEDSLKETLLKLLIDDSIENIVCYKSNIRVDENISAKNLIDFNKFDLSNIS